MCEAIHLSIKELSALVGPDFCPRCFWITLHMRHGLPFQAPQAGIYFAIEAYCRRLIHRWIDVYHQPPPWLSGLGDLKAYQPLPHHKPPFVPVFSVTEPEYGITISGGPSDALIRPDKSYLLVDYKAAKYTEVQQNLFPMYAARLNAYAWVGQFCRLTPVSGLALVYLEPATNRDAVADETKYSEDGFGVDFTATVLDAPMDADTLISLFAQTREIYDCDPCPDGREGCQDCKRLNHLLTVMPR